MEANTFAGRLLSEPAPPGTHAWEDLEVDPLWPTRAPVAVRVRCDRDLTCRVYQSFQRGSYVCVVGRAWISDPQGPCGKRFYVSAREITGIRQAIPQSGAGGGSRYAPGWTQIVATGMVMGDIITVTETGAGRATGEFVIAPRRRSGLAHMIVRAPMDAGKALRHDDHVRVTGTLAMDPSPGDGLDEDSIHVAADRLDVLATDIRSRRMKIVTVTPPRLATVHRLPTGEPGIGL